MLVTHRAKSLMTFYCNRNVYKRTENSMKKLRKNGSSPGELPYV